MGSSAIRRTDPTSIMARQALPQSALARRIVSIALSSYTSQIDNDADGRQRLPWVAAPAYPSVKPTAIGGSQKRNSSRRRWVLVICIAQLIQSSSFSHFSLQSPMDKSPRDRYP